MAFLRRKGSEALALVALPSSFDCLSVAEAPPVKSSGSEQAALAYVKHLSVNGDARRQLIRQLCEHRLAPGGKQLLAEHLCSEGFDTSLPAVLKVLEDEKSHSLELYAGRYQLFVAWSPDRSHPWDALPAAEQAAAVLEVGAMPDASGKVVLLLDGRPLGRYTFACGVLRTAEPVAWALSGGRGTARVQLTLAFGAALGYGRYKGAPTISYVGPQANGVLWADPADAPLDWPICPPQVAGKLNVTTRAAAATLGAIDDLGAFAGMYTLRHLAGPTDAQAVTVELIIKEAAGGAAVVLGGRPVEGWACTHNNMLTWPRGEGQDAGWLQLLAAPGGTQVLGCLQGPADDASVDVVGEPAGRASQVAPDGSVLTVLAEQSAAGIATAECLALAPLLRKTLKLWRLLGETEEGEELHPKVAALAAALDDEAVLLKRTAALALATEAAFPLGADARVLDPAAANGACEALRLATDGMLSAKAACVSASEAARAVGAATHAGDIVQALYKTSIAASRAATAAKSASHAETAAQEATGVARRARTAAAVASAGAACQSFHQAKAAAAAASAALTEAASTAMAAVEDLVQQCVKARDYSKLRPLAQTSVLAGQALGSAREATAGWGSDTVNSRRAAYEAAEAAALSSTAAHRQHRSVQV